MLKVGKELVKGKEEGDIREVSREKTRKKHEGRKIVISRKRINKEKVRGIERSGRQNR